MQTITVRDRQCFLDIAMQYAGSAEEALNIAVANGLPVTADLAAGLQLPQPAIVDSDVVGLYKTLKAIPASVLPGSGQLEGIGYWYIQNDFIVQ